MPERADSVRAATDTARTRIPPRIEPATGTPRRGLGLAVVLLATVLDLLDSLVTTVAGPSITRDLHGDPSLIQWLTAGYTVAMAAGILAGGRLGDIHGRRTCLLTGMAGFTLASGLCAIAQNPEQLVVMRIAQGLLGALMVPQGFGLVKEMFPPSSAGRAMAAMGPVIAIASLGGPLLAGSMLTADLFGLGWRTIFLINVPLGILGLAGGLTALPRSSRHPQVKLDLPGAALAAAAMGMLVAPLILGRQADWTWWVWLLLTTAVGLFALFVLLERVRHRRGRSTLVAATLFAKRAFVGGVTTGLTLFAALIGLSIALTVFTQIGLGFSPLLAALAGLPQAVGMVVGFGSAQGIASRGVATRTVMRAGIVAILVGLAGLAVTIGITGERTTVLSMAPALFAVGVGNGLTMAPFFELVLSVVEFPEMGTASGALTAAQQVGASAGIALLGAVQFTVIGPRSLASHGDSGAYVLGTQTALGVAVALVLLAALATTALPRRAVR